MIKNASNNTIGSSGMGLPNVSVAMLTWFQALIFFRVTKLVRNARTVEEKEEIVTKGTWQSLSASKIQLKPEGIRQFAWVQLHCLPDTVLRVDDIINYEGRNFRVESCINENMKYGYLEYHLVEDFEDTK